MWTYAKLKAADAALGIADPGAAAAALAAQTVTLTGQPFPWSAAVVVAQESVNFSWSRIQARSKQTATLPPSTATDYAILAALSAISTPLDRVIDPSNTVAWQTLLGGMQALVGIGDMIAADVTAIEALGTQVVPTWQPAPTAGDLQTARAQP